MQTIAGTVRAHPPAAVARYDVLPLSVLLRACLRCSVPPLLHLIRDLRALRSRPHRGRGICGCIIWNGDDVAAGRTFCSGVD